jgi:septation ring formation regulator EzrA
MESLAMEKDQLEQIGLYVKKNLPKWMGESSKAFRSEIDLRERTVRVEEELRSQRDLMKQGFDAMEKRFEQIDKRFDQVDKRFEQVDKRFEQVDKRFEQVDKRFELILDQMDKRFGFFERAMDKRFEQVDKRLMLMTWAMGIGFTAVLGFISIAIAVIKN